MADAGRNPTSSLFFELNDGTDKYTPIYSLEEFHNVFLELADLTEYKAAKKLVGEWTEWTRLKNGSPTFKRLVNEWKEELKVKLESEAYERILSLVNSDKEATALSAAKWFAENGWEKSSKGRPTKAQIEAEKKRMAQEANVTSDELDRVTNIVSIRAHG